MAVEEEEEDMAGEAQAEGGVKAQGERCETCGHRAATLMEGKALESSLVSKVFSHSYLHKVGTRCWGARL